MRSFVAVDIPEEIKKSMISIQKEFSPFDVKLVEAENLHFTLKFLGEINEADIETVSEKLSVVAKDFSPFNILLGGMGAFSSLSYIRVVWIAAVSDDFVKLHKAVAGTLGGIGKPESAVPHLTIARIRSARDKETIARIIKRYEKENFGSMLVNEIALKKSTLTPRGPIYENIGVFELCK